MAMVVLTPNLTGRDGISHLARLIVRAFDDVSVVVLHEPVSCTRFEHAEVSSAGGGSARFAALALQHAARCGTGTTVIVVHAHLAPAAVAFAARGASIVTCLCGIEVWRPLSWTQRAALQHSDRLVAISQHTADRFRETNPSLAALPVAICHPGVADGPGYPAPTGPPRALIVGRMASNERYKGHDALLGVWRDVQRAVPGARLDIVGDGDDRPRLEARAAELGLGSAVEFTGSIGDDERERALQRCMVLAMPSRDEGFGLVFLEAMRAARACLGGVGAASEIVTAESGFIVAADDRLALVNALVTTLGNPEGAAAMGRCGRQRFVDDFTETHFRRRFAALVQATASA